MASCSPPSEADLLQFAYMATPSLSCTYSRAARFVSLCSTSETGWNCVRSHIGLTLGAAGRARHRTELVTDDAKVLREQSPPSASASRRSKGSARWPIPEEKARGRKDRGNGLETGPASTERTRDKGEDAQPEKAPEQEKSRDPRGNEMRRQFLPCLRLGRLPGAC